MSFVAYSPTLPVGQVCKDDRHVFQWTVMRSLLTDTEGRLLPRQSAPASDTRCQCDAHAWEDEDPAKT